MLKSAFLKILRSIVLVLLLFNIAVGGAFAQERQPQNANSPQPSEIRGGTEAQPVRSDPRRNRETVSPSPNRSQERATPSRRSNGERPKDPYEDYYDAMKKFNEEVYGKGG
ncbi:MAG: hypothetical protein QNJ46_24235 [Leptolyngbyaceae cyanobacterium MO_188.B28]|nr:hypothetical protein [Leptolyngbyaceae cyanobacterium MO_188.B28]